MKNLALLLVFLACSNSLCASQREQGPFAVRGTLPWHNFLSGPTAWNEDDYRRYLDRMAELGLNFIAFHCYTGGVPPMDVYVEPTIRIEYRGVVPEASYDTSLTARWGYRPLAVKDFAFGTSKLFSLPPGEEAFGAMIAVGSRSKEERYKRAQDLMNRVIEMAHERGIQVAIGFEFGIHPPEFGSVVPPRAIIPGTSLPDPSHPASIEILRATIDAILTAYPTIDWIWLWQHELPMDIGRPQPVGGFLELMRKDSTYFYYTGTNQGIFNGVWSLAYIRAAHAYLSKRAPQVKVAVSGWSGQDQITEILRGLDAALPIDIVFAPLSPMQGMAPQPRILGEIAKHREVWAIPWLEGDRSLWHLQLRVSLLREHILLAREQGLAGVIALHWRTEETRANLSAFAEFARNPEDVPTLESFYARDCEAQFGTLGAAELGPILTRIDREQWLQPVTSHEYFPYATTWGRLSPDLRSRLVTVNDKIREVRSRTKGARHQENLRWLESNLRFTLLLDEVGQHLESVESLKDKWLLGNPDTGEIREQAVRAEQSLRSAPMEELFHTFVSRIRSRGELGELSSLNQKLWLHYKDLEVFVRFVLGQSDDSAGKPALGKTEERP